MSTNSNSISAESSSQTAHVVDEGTHEAKRQRMNSPSPSSSGAPPGAAPSQQQRVLHLAVVGCSHGEMDAIYKAVAEKEAERGIKIDLLLCCGDFQAVRNYGDLHHMNVPQHHKKLMTFYKYYKGEATAPVLTLFIGGNHESSGYSAELPNGGWVAPNIYYMGFASVVQFGGLRIGGWSGIYKSEDYNLGHYEVPPFHAHGSKRFDPIVSVYHVRALEKFRLKQLAKEELHLTLLIGSSDGSDANHLDVMMTHDWPAGITKFGNEALLRRWKPYFCEDIDRNKLGNPATMELLYVKFPAEVEHFAPDGSRLASTRFLALDKPMLDKPNSNRRYAFIDFIDIPLPASSASESAQLELCYDPVWLAILKNTDFLTEVTDRVYMPSRSFLGERTSLYPTEEELKEVERLFAGDFRIPFNFHQTAPVELNPGRYMVKANLNSIQPSLYYRNPQSTEFCERLGIRDLNWMLCQKVRETVGIPYYVQAQQQVQEPPAASQQAEARSGGTAPPSNNPDEIDLGDDDFGDNDFIIDTTPINSAP